MAEWHNFVTIQDTDMLHLFKLQDMYFSDNLIRFSRKWLICIIWIHKLLILCLFESRHSQVSKTVFILKFGPLVAKTIKFEVQLICIN